MILVNRLSFACRSNTYPLKAVWAIRWKESILNGNNISIIPVALCKQCVQHSSSLIKPCQPYFKLSFPSRVFLTASRNVFRYIRRTNSSKVSGDLSKGSARKSEKPTKISKKELRRLLGLARPERWKLTGAIILLLISSAVTMAVPFALGKVIDIIYTEDAEKMKENLNTLCITLFAVFVIGALCNFGRVYLMNLSGQRITRALRERVFGSVMKQEVAYFDQNRTGELINRLSTDTSVVSQCVTMNISDGLRSTVMVCAGISMMFYMSPQLALVGLTIVPPIAGMAIVYGRFVRNITKNVQDSLAEATQVAEERIGNIRTVKAFSQEEREINTYSQRMQHVMDLAIKESFARGIFFGMTGLSGNVIILSVLYYGGVMVSDANITVGNLSSFLLYAAYIGVSLGGLSSFYSELNRGLGASTRLWDIIDRVPAIPYKGGLVLPDPPRGEVSFEKVSFSYPSRPDSQILRDLDLTILSGKITAVVGASGSGKSTLAALLMRLYDPQAGFVKLDGVSVGTYDPSWLRSHIGFVSQEPVLFSGTIRENIVYGSEHPQVVSDSQVETAAREANAYNFITKDLSEGFDTRVGERGIMLSGGQKQRVAIARALIKNPRILLLDEATSALDAESEHLVQEALERIMKTRTVLTIAHRLSTIRNADQIAVLSEGKVVELGTYDQLIAESDGAFRKLVKHQTFQS